MKNFIITVILSGFFTYSYSQQFPQVSTDSLFMELDKTEMKTGLLYNKVYPFSAIKKYNGVYDTVGNLANWKQMYSELYRSAVTQTNLIPLDSIKKKARALMDNNSGIVPFGILWYKYDKIKEYAIDSNLLIRENNRYNDVIGRKETPYAENIAFSATPFISRIDGYSVRFLFSNEFFFSNTGNSIQYLEADFDDGNGFKKININDEVSVNYSSSGPNPMGRKIIKLKVFFQGGQLQSSAELFVGSCSALSDPKVNESLTSSIPYPPNSYSYGKGNYYIRYGKGNGTSLKKPLIFVEGIDFGQEHTTYKNGEFGWCPSTGLSL